MLCVIADADTFTVSSYFEYPNEDLYERDEELEKEEEMIKLITDINGGLVYL